MYLVDGNNLIGHTRDLSLKDRTSRQQLIDRLIPFLAQKRQRALVFFDGNTEPLRKSARVQLTFSGPKVTADELIRRKVEQARAPGNLCVVSSDNRVYGHARSCGSRAIKCHEFNHLMKDLRSPPVKPEQEVRQEDLKDWMRYFGEEDA